MSLGSCDSHSPFNFPQKPPTAKVVLEQTAKKTEWQWESPAFELRWDEKIIILAALLGFILAACLAYKWCSWNAARCHPGRQPGTLAAENTKLLVCLLAVRWLTACWDLHGHPAFVLVPRVAIWSTSCKCETALGLLAGCQGSPQLSYDDNTTAIFYRDQLKCWATSIFKHVGSPSSELLSMAILKYGKDLSSYCSHMHGCTKELELELLSGTSNWKLQKWEDEYKYTKLDFKCTLQQVSETISTANKTEQFCKSVLLTTVFC